MYYLFCRPECDSLSPRRYAANAHMQTLTLRRLLGNQLLQVFVAQCELQQSRSLAQELQQVPDFVVLRMLPFAVILMAHALLMLHVDRSAMYSYFTEPLARAAGR